MRRPKPERVRPEKTMDRALEHLEYTSPGTIIEVNMRAGTIIPRHSRRRHPAPHTVKSVKSGVS
jgi:hypothetical protein